MKYRVLSINRQDDLVYENLLRLGECIVTKELRPMNHYLSSFYDKKEEKKNYEKIDYIRALGTMTDAEYEIWLYDLKKKLNRRRSYGPATRVINKYAGTKQVYKNMREACEDNNVKYSNLVELFKAEKTKKVKYKGLIFEKLK